MTAPVALVVGAGKGIGRAVAHTLARSDRTVALVDADEISLSRTAQEIDGSVSRVLDVRDELEVARVVAEIESSVGPIENLAYVAGILHTDDVLDSSTEDWRNMFDVNLFGLLHVVRCVGSAMRERRSGSIVTVGSNAAGIPRMSMGAYGSSKAASTMLTRVLGLELAQYGVRVNVVAPGSTDTDMQRSLWPDPTDDAGAGSAIAGELSTFKTGIPLGRIATPQDIADAVEFLLSDRARHITMQSLYVDGGATLHT
ncbi:2,3-dihydro-2,3-dihydroxybenzoate dehydrogenase [Rhodococcoides yunnanense]|uniref:2,3-dihydro-2,3-dihydroxybenzoate dehydrogenase n=1 Tax=Rhodococcoides yunnanense TaxID=278209 RepID=UPI000932DDF7|nr:2,3-dihydro-2,3-dihydroxybenzoate dehydrogenase [Rhodococcus yunnanensis]